MLEWKTLRLGDAISIKHGYAFKGEYFSEENPGPILLTPGNFSVGGGFKRSKPKYYLGPVPEEFRLQGGDLVVTMTDLSKAGDTLGYPAIIPSDGDYLHNQRIGLVSTDQAVIDKLFLFYALRTNSYRQHVLAGATGSTVRHTSPKRIAEYKIAIPGIKEQKAIAAVLGALDDKIAVNDRISATAHELGQAIIRQALVDVEPVKLSEIANITMGSSPPGESYNEDSAGVPFYQGTRDFGDRFPTRRVWCTSPVRMADEGACLLSVRAPVGRINIAREPCCIGRGLAAVMTRQSAPSVLYHELIAATEVWAPYESEGTVFGAINKKQLDSIEIPALDRDTAHSLEQTLLPLDQRVAAVFGENHKLAKLRDTLLPKLMSGQIRVRDAEKVVEDAVLWAAGCRKKRGNTSSWTSSGSWGGSRRKARRSLPGLGSGSPGMR